MTNTAICAGVVLGVLTGVANAKRRSDLGTNVPVDVVGSDAFAQGSVDLVP